MITDKFILFDMDGTLVDSEPTHALAMSNAIRFLGGIPPENFSEISTGMSIEDCYRALQETITVSFSLNDLVTAKYAAYLQLASTLQLRQGAYEALAYIRHQAAGYAIVSNSDRIIVEANLEAVELTYPGAITVSRNDVIHGKPCAEPYLRAAYLLGAQPENCIVVEDSYVGAQAGLNAGMTVIGWPELHRADMSFPKDVHVADPTNLIATLNTLLANPISLFE